MQTRDIVRINGKARCKVVFTEGRWAGRYEPLRLTTESRTWSGLVELMAAAADIALRRKYERGELEEWVQSLGWSLDGLPEETFPSELTFDLPFILDDSSGGSAASDAHV